MLVYGIEYQVTPLINTFSVTDLMIIVGVSNTRPRVHSNEKLVIFCKSDFT